MASLSLQPSVASPSPRATETKKGQPGSTPTFPNGLRDVHEMAAAAEALADLGGENGAAAERNREHHFHDYLRCRDLALTQSPQPTEPLQLSYNWTVPLLCTEA